MVSSFKDLIVWQKSVVLASQVYKLCANLPGGEAFGLASQMKRSAVSIPSNIAEGSKRTTTKDYRQFIAVARGSAAELETQLIIANNVYGIADGEANQLINEVQRMLTVLSRKLKDGT
jgi:four helix bundle protein